MKVSNRIKKGLGVLLLLASVAISTAAAQGARPIGEITCSLTISVELTVGARRPLHCVFQPAAANKSPVPLEITIDHYGADVRLMKQVELSWTVSGSSKVSPQKLAGTYNGNLELAAATDPANELGAGGPMRLMPMRHDNPEVFNLAKGVATITVRLK